MSKTLEEAHVSLDKWHREGSVGNIIFYRAPGLGEVDCLIEQVVKLREMEPKVASAFNYFMNELGVDRGEIHRNSNGDPDRVKLTRSFDE